MGIQESVNSVVAWTHVPGVMNIYVNTVQGSVLIVMQNFVRIAQMRSRLVCASLLCFDVTCASPNIQHVVKLVGRPCVNSVAVAPWTTVLPAGSPLVTRV